MRVMIGGEWCLRRVCSLCVRVRVRECVHRRIAIVALQVRREKLPIRPVPVARRHEETTRHTPSPIAVRPRCPMAMPPTRQCDV